MKSTELENLIYEYHWRKKELDRISNILWGGRVSLRSNLTAQYGIESTLPKPNTNLISKAEMDDLDARELRLYGRWQDYQAKVYSIEILAEHLQNEQYLIILDCMMEGMSYRSIADHLSVSRTKVGEMKNEMLFYLCQKCQF